MPGTGFHPFEFNPDGTVSDYTDDYGYQMSLKQGDAGDWNFGAGWFMRLDLAGSSTTTWNTNTTPNNSGADCYRWTIKNCVGTTVKIGDEISFDTARAARRARPGRRWKRMVLATRRARR